MMRCGYCFGVVESMHVDPGRCPCGRRAITPMPGGTLVHREGCDGSLGVKCACALGSWPPELDGPKRALLDPEPPNGRKQLNAGT